MREPAEFLDPSVPEVLERVAADVARFAEWGFELVKHDFTTFDCFGKWGFEMNEFPAAGDWSFRDTTRTSAEILLELYRRIRQAAGEMLILGCNTVGHFGAGLMHLSRIGDDTSGQRWERTRKMGVNTLAFRLPQHGAFFAVDADCLGVPWELNRQWARLLATSGTPLFASLKPGVLGERKIGRCGSSSASLRFRRARRCRWTGFPTSARKIGNWTGRQFVSTGTNRNVSMRIF